MYPCVDHLSFHKFSLTITQYYINSLRDYTNALLICYISYMILLYVIYSKYANVVNFKLYDFCENE